MHAMRSNGANYLSRAEICAAGKLWSRSMFKVTFNIFLTVAAGLAAGIILGRVVS
jgi:hypothetical protein